MKGRSQNWGLAGLLLVLGAQQAVAETNKAAGVDRDQITQVSVINALMLGQYDGVMPLSEFLRYGDFGLGTIDHLDGELVVLDGTPYQIRADGAVATVGSDRSIPFAVITPFDRDGELPCPVVTSLSALESHLNDAVGRKNVFVAFRVQVKFASVTMRSVPRQEPPYRPLSEVAKGQTVWTRKDVAGTLVAVRSPGWVNGLTVPGYHWHFLADDRKSGGHVLDCEVVEGRVEYDVCTDWMIKLVDTSAFHNADLGQDLKRDLHRVESTRGTASDEEASPKGASHRAPSGRR